jgi:hypothetical protein
MSGLKWLAVTGPGGVHLRDPAGADPGLLDVLRCFLSSDIRFWSSALHH